MTYTLNLKWVPLVIGFQGKHCTAALFLPARKPRHCRQRKSRVISRKGAKRWWKPGTTAFLLPTLGASRSLSLVWRNTCPLSWSKFFSWKEWSLLAGVSASRHQIVLTWLGVGDDLRNKTPYWSQCDMLQVACLHPIFQWLHPISTRRSIFRKPCWSGQGMECSAGYWEVWIRNNFTTSHSMLLRLAGQKISVARLHLYLCLATTDAVQ